MELQSHQHTVSGKKVSGKQDTGKPELTADELLAQQQFAQSVPIIERDASAKSSTVNNPPSTRIKNADC